VAFVSLRATVGAVTVEALRAHCQASLTSSYVPKFFVILPDLPHLPNGKPNLKELTDLATQHAAEEGEVVMDSLGQMKKLSKWAIFENAVIHRCYAFWMIGVLTDHYMRCALDSVSEYGDPSNENYYPFCTVLARKSVKPWTEMLVRTFFGNDQDMFGFIMLGAYQDSRPASAGAPPRVNLGTKDAFVFLVYMLMALPVPQLMSLIFPGDLAWPTWWGLDDDRAALPSPASKWDWGYMQYNSHTSDHRWYLLMVLEARIFLQICEKLRLPGWLQGVIVTVPCLLPNAIFEGREYAFDVCENEAAPHYVLYTFSWIFRNFGDGCAMYWRWVQWYVAFYVWSFHFLRPFVAWGQRTLPARFKSRTWAAVAFSSSMMIGMAMGMCHYPNNVLENGTGMQWAWLEVGVDMIQPSLIAMGMSYLPFNLSFWGNTTLGCYVFHFYFKDTVGRLVMSICDGLAWDPTGLAAFLAIIGLCVLFCSTMGPLGHYVLISPSLIGARISRAVARRAQARQLRAASAPAACVAGSVAS